MKTFEQFSEAVKYGEKRCTAVTCNAITDYHKVPEAKLGSDHNISHGYHVISHLKKHGMKVHGLGTDHIGKTVSQFVDEHPTGAHYIMTAGHSMAVINGKLHDASNRAAHRKSSVDKRKIQGSFEITKN